MTALLASVFLASVLGGLHCAGMCGGFVCAISTPGRAFVSQAAWHLGRGAAYVALGFAAGLLGRGLEVSLAGSGVSHAAAIVAGAMLVVRGVAELTRGPRPRPARPVAWAPVLARGLRAVRALSVVPRALLVGGLTALLPCGWLWAFVATAAGTGRPWAGALVMLTFWSGTLPLLAGVGFAASRALAPLRDRLPRVTAIAMVVVGLLTVAGRFRAHPASHGAGHAAASAHSHAMAPSLAPEPTHGGH